MNITKRFDSVGEFVRYIEAGETQPAFSYNTASKGIGKDYEKFTGTKSWEDACELLRDGDTKTAEKIDARKRMACNRIGTEFKKRLELSVSGHTPSVSAYLSGARKCMYRTAQKPTRARVANVVINIGIPGKIKTKEMQAAAAEVLQAVSAVERGGTRLNIFIGWCNRDRNQEHTVAGAIKIKDSGQYLNILKVAYPIANPSMLRRHRFRYQEVTPGIPSVFAVGYGYSHFPKSAFWSETLGIKNAIVFNIFDLIEFGSRSDAIAKAINEGAEK